MESSSKPCMMHLLVVFLLLLVIDAQSNNIVRTLPGYPGTLPFKLETGYISVGENEQVNLFYYFVESERDPERDPLVFWLTGGPGCSGFSALVYEIGPLAFNVSSFDGSLPSLVLNPYSWTKVANIIFIDSPAGTGFSYATTSQGYASSDTKSAKDNYTFLRKWLLDHPTFIKNSLYVAGDSYGGEITPMVALEIAKGNEAELEPQMILQVNSPLTGYIVGNPKTDDKVEGNEVIPYVHRMGLISDEYFEIIRLLTISASKKSCSGDYVTPDPNNYKCLYALRLVNDCTHLINTPHMLERKCKFLSPKPDDSKLRPPLLEDDPVNFLLLYKPEEPWCRHKNYRGSYVWATDEALQHALHIKKGTITDWTRCNKSLSYENDVESVVEYHKLLNEKGYQALVYSGDHDLEVTHMSTLKWIHSLNLTIDDHWRPWTVIGQVAGYTEKYKNNEAYITFATVKGAGHTAPEYNPKEFFAMVKRWLSLYPL